MKMVQRTVRFAEDHLSDEELYAKRSSEFYRVVANLEEQPHWWIKFLLKFTPDRQVTHPDATVYIYKKLRGVNYNLRRTCWKSITRLKDYYDKS